MTSINSGQRPTWPKKVSIQTGADLDLGDGTYEEFCFFVVVNIGLLSHCLEPSHKKKVIFFDNISIFTIMITTPLDSNSVAA